MQVRSADFKTAAAQKLGDKQLYRALTGLRTRMVAGRAIAIQELDNFEEIREAGSKASDLTRQLLTFSRQQVLERLVDRRLVERRQDRRRGQHGRGDPHPL